jgi:hypothetical protein
MTIPTYSANVQVKTATVSIHWKDQGWGNRKGACIFRIMRGDTKIADEGAFGIASHRWATANHTFSSSFINHLRAGDKVQVLFRVGGGGGHSLHVQSVRFDM